MDALRMPHITNTTLGAFKRVCSYETPRTKNINAHLLQMQLYFGHKNFKPRTMHTQYDIPFLTLKLTLLPVHPEYRDFHTV